MSKGKSRVSLVKNPNPEAAVGEALELLGGFRRFVDRGDTVLVKPNLALPVPPKDSPETTHPDVAAAVVRLLKEAGAERVIVGDAPAYGLSAKRSFEVTGIGEAVTKEGAELCCFDEAPRITVDVPNGKFWDKLSVPKILKEVDLFVNVPKMKTSFIAEVTLGVKNLLGCIRWEDRQKWHREMDLAYVFVDIAKAVPPNLTIIDGIIAMEGTGPHFGPPKRMDTIVAGEDVVAVDAVTANVMGYDPLEPPSTQFAQKEGLGTADLSKIEVLGEAIEDVEQPFKRPVLKFVNPHPNVEVYLGGFCPGCAPRIPHIPPNPDPNKKYAVVVGRRVKLPDKLDVDEIWFFGKCGSLAYSPKFLLDLGRENVKIVPGCPPLAWYARNVVFPMLRKKGYID